MATIKKINSANVFVFVGELVQDRHTGEHVPAAYIIYYNYDESRYMALDHLFTGKFHIDSWLLNSEQQAEQTLNKIKKCLTIDLDRWVDADDVMPGYLLDMLPQAHQHAQLMNADLIIDKYGLGFGK